MPRVSKKNKSNWRKSINLADVDKFLEDQRQDERIGSIADKSDADLFVTEVTSEKPVGSLKQSRINNFEKPPRFALALENTSKVADPIRKRNIVKNVDKLQVRKAKQDKHDSRVQRGPASTYKKTKIKKPNFGKDIWAEEDDTPTILKSEWINETTKLHHMTHTAKPIVKAAASTHAKPNAIPNVEVPASGTSYNPSIDDYNEHKQAVIEKEKQILKRERHLTRVVTEKFVKIPEKERNEMVLKEMSEGLFNTEEEANAAESSDEEDYAPINPPVENKKKDRKTLNKQHRHKAKCGVQAKVARELKKLKDINRVSDLNAEVTKTLNKTAKKSANRIQRQEDKKMTTGRVAYLKYEEPEADFTEVTELAGSLRELAPNKSLVADRYKSFQKRTLIAPKKHRDGILRSNRSTLKKWKRYTLNSHKEQ